MGIAGFSPSETGPPTETTSIQMTAELLDDLAQAFRVFFDDLQRLL
jgi:hypothetical protein